MDILYKIVFEKATLNDQEEALKEPYFAYRFARDVPGADIERCQEAACQDLLYTYCFARDIPGADIDKCIELCKGTGYEDTLNQLLMDKALL